jgi:hypothetical protein
VTIDVQTSPPRRRIDRVEVDRASVAVRTAVVEAPERLLLIFLSFSYVAAVAYVTGLFRPIVVFPTTLAIVVLTWRFYPRASFCDRESAIGSTVCLGAVSAWFLVNLPYISERVVVSRDPDIYTLTALWLVDHSSPSIPVLAGSSGSLGFSLVDGALRPQGNHLVAGVSAAAGWIFGEEAVFWGNLACGAAALVALYVLARRVVGPLWGLVPMLALAVSLPMLAFSRSLYSEPLAMTFTLLGAALLWTAWVHDDTTGYLLGGLSLGGVALARIDGTLPLLGVLVGLTVAAFIHGVVDEQERRHRAAPLVLLGSLPGLLLGFADLYFHSGRYISDLRSELTLLVTGFGVAAAIVLAGLLLQGKDPWRPTIGRVLARSAVVGAALAAVLFTILLTRPWWYVSRGDDDTPLGSMISAVQAEEGSPVDGTRRYSEHSLEWISWYYGWPVVLVGLGGLLAWLIIGARPKGSRLLWLSALSLPSALLYLTEPSITPDHIWAMRRFLPVVVPGLLLATVWTAGKLAGRSRGGAVVATVLALSVVAWPLTTLQDVWTARSKAGALAGNRLVCAQIDDRPTIVTGIDTYLPTVLILCDVPAVSVPEPTAERLAAAREWLGGGSVVVATRDPGPLPWVDGQPPTAVQYTQTELERSLTEAPDGIITQDVSVTLGSVRPDGSVTPLLGGS